MISLSILSPLPLSLLPFIFYSYMSLNLALRFILEALKKPPSSKMHLFGLAALDKCKKRLKDFPQFCVSIAGLSHFQSFPSQLKQVSTGYS